MNNAIRTVTGYVCPTPADNLPILACVQPAEVRHKVVAQSLASRTHGTWSSAPLSARLSTGWESTASQIETPICTRRTTTHQFF